MNVWSLWLPILATGLATHVMSTLAWMVLPHHKPEWKKLPDREGGSVEDDVLDLLDGQKVPAGQYMFPFTQDMQEMQSDEFKAKQGRCRGTLILWPAPVSMGAAIGKTLAFFFVAAFSIGYLASLALAPGAEGREVFRFVATAALLTHCFGEFPGVFWFKRKVAMDLIDKVAYALVTGLLFMLLWPAVEA